MFDYLNVSLRYRKDLLKNCTSNKHAVYVTPFYPVNWPTHKKQQTLARPAGGLQYVVPMVVHARQRLSIHLHLSEAPTPHTPPGQHQKRRTNQQIYARPELNTHEVATLCAPDRAADRVPR